MQPGQEETAAPPPVACSCRCRCRRTLSYPMLWVTMGRHFSCPTTEPSSRPSLSPVVSRGGRGQAFSSSIRWIFTVTDDWAPTEARACLRPEALSVSENFARANRFDTPLKSMLTRRQFLPGVLAPPTAFVGPLLGPTQEPQDPTGPETRIQSPE